MDDIERDAIAERIRERFEQCLHRPSPAEVRSWQNSMQHMYKVLTATEGVPSACAVAIEFGSTSIAAVSVRCGVRVPVSA